MSRIQNMEMGKTIAAAGSALTLAIGAHGVGASNVEASPVHNPATAAANHPTLVFDDLGGGYPDIFVYPSVSAKSIGNWPEHYAFADGDPVPALCKKLGRLVRSDPSVGERKRESRWWIKIDGIPSGVTEYATATYVEKPKTLLHKLHACVRAKKQAS